VGAVEFGWVWNDPFEVEGALAFGELRELFDCLLWPLDGQLVDVPDWHNPR
jgi:hypothetical protein